MALIDKFPKLPTYDLLVKTYLSELRANNKFNLDDASVLYLHNDIIDINEKYVSVSFKKGDGVIFYTRYTSPDSAVRAWRKYAGDWFKFYSEDNVWKISSGKNSSVLCPDLEYNLRTGQPTIAPNNERVLFHVNKDLEALELCKHYLDHITWEDIVRCAIGAQPLEYVVTLCKGCLAEKRYHLKEHVLRNEITFYLIYSVYRSVYGQEKAIQNTWDLIEDCKLDKSQSKLLVAFISFYRSFLFSSVLNSGSLLLDGLAELTFGAWQQKYENKISSDSSWYYHADNLIAGNPPTVAVAEENENH